MQTWVLAVHLPLMIGKDIPVDNPLWECYLLLLDIVKVCTGYFATHCLADYLAALISDHHMMFRQCYPNASITPKMHYMVHFSAQMIRYFILIVTYPGVIISELYLI